MSPAAPLALAGLLAALPALAAEPDPVDLELLLLADASGSIDATENHLQREGYAAAMTDREVLWAVRHGGALGRIAVAYVEWAGRRSQDVVVDWTLIDGEAAARGFAARLMAAPRKVSGVNAIGAALLEGLALIDGNGFDGWRKVIDLSGDSIWNPRPPTLAEARDAALARDVTINGLAVLCQDCSGRPGLGSLEADFTDRLIVGPGAFVVTADGDTAFADAVRRKLILEISGSPSDRVLAISDLPKSSPMFNQ
jgi:hypothetical protein